MRYYLSPLSQKETEEYIEKRLRIAGAQDPLFTKGAIREIYRRSKGKPRLINVLCDNALLTGYALGQKLVNVRLVREVTKDLKLGKTSQRMRGGLILSVSVTVAIILLIYLQKNGYLSPFLKEIIRGAQYVEAILINGVQHFLNWVKS